MWLRYLFVFQCVRIWITHEATCLWIDQSEAAISSGLSGQVRTLSQSGELQSDHLFTPSSSSPVWQSLTCRSPASCSGCHGECLRPGDISKAADFLPAWHQRGDDQSGAGGAAHEGKTPLLFYFILLFAFYSFSRKVFNLFHFNLNIFPLVSFLILHLILLLLKFLI